MLVSLEGYEDNLLGKSKFKKLKKVVPKPVQKFAKSKIGKMVIDAAAMSMGVPVPPSVLMKTVSKAKKAVKGNKGLKNALVDIALEQTGLDDIKNLKDNIVDKIEAVKELPESVQNTFAKNFNMNENSAIKKATENTVKNRYGQTVKRSTVKRESAGDQLYKKGLLSGDEQDLKLLATKIYSQNPYPSEVPLPSWEFVQKVLQAYIYSVNKLSAQRNQNLYYNGTTEAERQQFYGNLYIRISYLYFEGFTTDAEVQAAGYNYELRDQIWVVLAQLKKFAESDSTKTFMKFWQPYAYKPKIGGGMDNKTMLIAGGGLLAALFFMKKKGR